MDDGSIHKGSDRQWSEAEIRALISEYSALQSARAGTVFESGGRLTGFLSTLSSFVVALAFIGQVSQLGRPFFLFAAVLLPTLFFIGVVTYTRVLQNGIEDLLVTRGMARIRAALGESAPAARPYFVLAANDDVLGHMRNMGIDPRKRQLLFTTASMVAVLDSLIAGVFIAIAMMGIFGTSTELAAMAGILFGGLCAGTFLRHEAKEWRQAEESLKPMFPSGEGAERTPGPHKRLRPWRGPR